MAKKQSAYVKRVIKKAIEAHEAARPRPLDMTQEYVARVLGETRTRELNNEQLFMVVFAAEGAERANADVLSAAEEFVQAWVAHPRDAEDIGRKHAELIRVVLNRRVSEDKLRNITNALRGYTARDWTLDQKLPKEPERPAHVMADINEARETITKATGFQPNTLIMGDKVARKLGIVGKRKRVRKGVKR